jgi:alpha-ribazole phosphatase
VNARVRIDLLRHGDTGQRSYRGQLDDALTETGWRQLRDAVRDGEWDAIVSSSLRRCAEFAAELADIRGLPLRIDPRLAEYHFGRWQGVPIDTLHATDAEALGHFWRDPGAHPPPDAEPFAAFHARLCAALDQVAEETQDRRVLVVTHGGAIRLLRCFAEGRGYGDMAGIDVPHASIHPLRWRLPVRGEDRVLVHDVEPVRAGGASGTG